MENEGHITRRQAIRILGVGALAAGSIPAILRQEALSVAAFTESGTPTVESETVQRIEITGNEFSFEPDVITLETHKPVELVYTNAGIIPHDWVVVSPKENKDDHKDMEHGHEEVLGTPEAMPPFIVLEEEAEDHGHSDDHDEAEREESGHQHNQGEESLLHMIANPGETKKLIVEPTRPGEYDVICSIPGHKEAGMVGKLIVKEAE